MIQTPVKNMVTFGQWVKQRRKALCLTQAQLGYLVSCSSVMINKIEGDLRRPSLQVAQLLATHLKIAAKDHIPFISMARPDLTQDQLNEIAEQQTQPDEQPGAHPPTPLPPLIGHMSKVDAVCGNGYDRFSTLVDQSLLKQSENNHKMQRPIKIETLREYTLEGLPVRNTESTALHHKHAYYYMTLVETGEKKFGGPEQEDWLDTLETEHDNLLAALAWSYSPLGDAEVGLRLATAIWQFWMVRGYISEGLTWLPRLLQQAQTASKRTRARALNGAGFLHWVGNNLQQARILLNESLTLFRELDDKHGTAWVLNHLGHVALALGELELAPVLVRESLSLFIPLKAHWNIAWDLLNLGDILLARGDQTAAAEHYVESLGLFRAVGDHRGAAWALAHLGRLAYTQRHYPRAKVLFNESLGHFRTLKDKWSIAWVLNHLGGVALAQGDYDHVPGLVEESLKLFLDLGDNRGATEAQERLRRLGNAPQKQEKLLLHHA